MEMLKVAVFPVPDCAVVILVHVMSTLCDDISSFADLGDRATLNGTGTFISICIDSSKEILCVVSIPRMDNYL
jgi:hypothetical protein